MEMAGKQAGQCRPENHAQDDADQLCARGARGNRSQPGPTQRSRQEGKTKGVQALELQKQIADPGADEAGPVVRRMAGGVATNCVERGIGGAIRDEGEKKKDRGNQHQEPDELIQAAVAGWRGDQFQGFHQGAMRCAPHETAYTDQNPRATPLFQRRPRQKGENLEKMPTGESISPPH
jgi:hypothetical protein